MLDLEPFLRLRARHQRRRRAGRVREVGRTHGGRTAAMALCAISGVAAEDPVVSVKSGHVFSARLVHKAWQELERQAGDPG